MISTLKRKLRYLFSDQKILDAIQRKNLGLGRTGASARAGHPCTYGQPKRCLCTGLLSWLDAAETALDALKAATADMNKVAARMRSLATIINNTADLAAASDKVIGALKG